MRTLTRLAAGLFVAAGAACQFPYPADVPDDDAPGTRALGGTVTGLWTGGALTLHLAAGDVTEDIAADATAPFAFTRRVADGGSYLVTVADDGPDHECAVTNGSGRVDGADVTDLAVLCTNQINHGFTISTPVPFTFDPRVTRYPLAVSVLQQQVEVTVTGAGLTSAKVAGQPVTLGQPSPPVPLGQGTTTVTVDVAKGALSQRYELVFDRGGAPIVEALYARAFNAGPGDRFGIGVAASGDWVAIGADGESSSSEAGTDDNTLRSGAVYMYRRNGAAWTTTQKLKGTALVAQRRFASALDMDGDTLVVGTRDDDALANNAGAVHVFRLDRGAGVWREEQRITAADASSNDRFGSAVSVKGDYLAVGAPFHDGGSGVPSNDFGRVYVYRRTGTVWSEEATIEAAPRTMTAYFGDKLDLDSESLAVNEAPGRAYVFRRSGVTWAPESLPANASGNSVSLEGDNLVVGAKTFKRTGSAWSFVSDLPLPEPNASIGPNVVLRGNLIVSGISTLTGPKLGAWQKVGGSWVAVAPAVGTSSNNAFEFGYGIAVAAYGVVIADFRNPGPDGSMPDSGTAWFFR